MSTDAISKTPIVFVSGSVRTHGEFWLESRKVHFQSIGIQEILLSWDEYSVSLEKQGENFILRSHSGAGEYLILPNAEFAKKIAKALDIQMRGKTHSFFSQRQFLLGSVITVGLFAACLTILIVAKSQTAKLIPIATIEEEIEYGQKFLSSDLTKDIVVLPAELQASWDGLINHLLKLPELPKYPWRVLIIKEKMVNAFALPGGTIVFTSAFLKQADSAEEILGVLSHEIAHISMRHVAVKIFRGQVEQILSLVFGDTGWFGTALQASENFHQQQFSREHEAEADLVGLSYLSQAGITSTGFIGFFRKSDEKSDIKIPDWLSSHPADETRINNIVKYGVQVSKVDFSDFPLASLKEAVSIND